MKKPQIGPYYEQQQECWKAFRKELERLRDTCGASSQELATGLGLSKGTVDAFLATPPNSEELKKVQRADILSLWSHITSEENYRNKRINEDKKRARRRLKDSGPDRLLHTLQFLPESGIVEGALQITDPQLQRIILRLSSPWMDEAALRAYVINEVLDKILDHGTFDKNSDTLNANDDRDEVINWPSRFNADSGQRLWYTGDETVLENYKRVVNNLINS